jgi:uncharacterized protein with NRDE domain
VCTLTIAWQTFPDVPVAVAANRDEALDRPSDSPGRYADDPAVVAPRDLEAGGTWIGYNEFGLFAGVTNRWVEVPEGGDRSRGLLVRDILAESSAEAALGLVEEAVAADVYEGFELVVADAEAAFLLEWDGALAVTRLDPGVHVVVNVGAALGGGGAVDDRFFVPEVRPGQGRQQAGNARRVRAALTPDPGEDADSWLARAGRVLGDHDYGVCVHGDGFGTRSSSLVRLAADPAARRYEFADGPPCTTDYVRVDASV